MILVMTLVCPSNDNGCNEWSLFELEYDGTILQGCILSNF